MATSRCYSTYFFHVHGNTAEPPDQRLLTRPSSVQISAVIWAMFIHVYRFYKQQPHALYQDTPPGGFCSWQNCRWCCRLLFSPRLSLALSHNLSPAHPDSDIVRERSRSPTSWRRFKGHIINCLVVNRGKKTGQAVAMCVATKKLQLHQ